MIENFYTAAEAATVLGITFNYVAILCKKGVLWGAKKVAGVWLIPVESVEIFKKIKEKKPRKKRAEKS